MALQPLTLPVHVADSSHTGHARRQAISMASSLGFSELRQGQLGIIVTEAAANVATHAGQGEIVLVPWKFQQDAGIDLLALDRGQGMTDVGRAFEDGYSTAGTAGQGLGAMSRMASLLQVYSLPQQGTALFARMTRESPTAEDSSTKYAVGGICLAMSGETVSGDAWNVHFTPGRSIYIVADGLGHGPFAAEAAQEAIRVFRDQPHLSPQSILVEIHRALTKTRGAAVSIAEILHDNRVVNYAGVGNIACAIIDGAKSRSLVSMNGTVGHTVGRIHQFSYAWESSSTLVMHSDGLATRWSVAQYPGLASRHPALIAGVLYRDFSRRRDDVTILVSRV
ncbi:MAG: SpoIIE family protein phosphatase [Acidobacteriota bacterium]